MIDRRPVTRHSSTPTTGQPVPAAPKARSGSRGYSLMQRLYKREREDVFTPDGYYRTGDCGVEYDDGWIKFTGGWAT